MALHQVLLHHWLRMTVHYSIWLLILITARYLALCCPVDSLEHIDYNPSGDDNIPDTATSSAPLALRCFSQPHNPPGFLKDYHCHLLKHESPLFTLNNAYSLDKYLSYEKLSPTHKHFLLSVSTDFEPSFYHEAVKHTPWRKAMDEEIVAMERTHTWSLVPLPPGHRAVDCKWVYRIKYKADGTVDRNKARLVAKGYNQQEGIDFLETFSPVAKIVTVKILLSLTASHNWSLVQMDVNNAFLNGELFEEVYMQLPLGYYADCKSSSAPLVCKLNKSIYGLKQASRQWFSKFSSVLLAAGFSQSKANYSLFTRGQGPSFVALLVYVDDILLTGPSLIEISRLRSLLHSQFLLKDLGNAKYFLGLELSRSTKGIYLSQRKYCL